MEHALNNVPATAYSRYWYSLRAFFPTHTAIFVGFRYLPGAGGEKWDLGYVTDRNRLLGASTACRVEPSGAYQGSKSGNVPSSFAVEMSEGDMRLSGTYQSMEMYSCTPVLQNMNWLLRKAITVFAGNPLIYRFRANATLFLQKPDHHIRLEGPACQAVVTMKELAPTEKFLFATLSPWRKESADHFTLRKGLTKRKRLFVTPRYATLQDAMIEVYHDSNNERRVRGRAMATGVHMIELLEDDDDIDELLDLGDNFKFLLQTPSVRVGKTFSPDDKSLLQTAAQGPLEKLDNPKYKEIRSKLGTLGGCQRGAVPRPLQQNPGCRTLRRP